MGTVEQDLRRYQQQIDEEDELDAATEEEKHLHVRGEDICHSSFRAIILETPPRTWRRLNMAFRCLA